MAIVNTNIPITADSCDRMILELVEKYPFCRTEVIGQSFYGRPLRALIIGNGERNVIYSAAHHANEWITALVLLKFAEDLAEAIQNGTRIYGIEAKNIAAAATIYLIPMVNPDGVNLVVGASPQGSLPYETAREMAAFYPSIPFPDGWKANLRGVDLNLQYPAGWLQAREIKFSQGFTRPGPRDYVGRAPLNQPESRALAEFTEGIDPILVLAYHAQGEVIYWQFRDYQVPGAEALAKEFARLSGYALEDTPYESSFAGYKDWFIQQYRRPGFTIEVGQGESPLPLSQFDKIYADNLGILTTAALGLPAGK
jgi:g-D-glutamyl-meso-diaminopimelate peptidase